MRPRIVHVIGGLGNGGAEMKLCKLLHKLSPKRFEHAVVSLTDWDGPIVGRLEQLGVPVYKCGMRPPLSNPIAAIRVVRLIRRLRPDLVQGWMYHANLAAQLAAAVLPADVPVIWNICDSRRRHEKFTTVLIDWLGAQLSRLPDRILSDSHASAHVHQHHRNFCGKRWEVIPSGFDSAQFRPSEEARLELRAQLSLPDDALLMGVIGRYNPVKAHTCFLEAAASIRRRIPHAHFLLIGRDVAGNQTLLDQVASLGLTGAVHLLAERADIERVSAALDIVVSSSISESLPSVIGEAMCCGVPCVVTNVGDTAKLVGETGLVVPPRDPEALASACVDLASRGREERKALGLAARERITREFSLDVFAARYEQVYREALDRRRPGLQSSETPGLWGAR